MAIWPTFNPWLDSANSLPNPETVLQTATRNTGLARLTEIMKSTGYCQCRCEMGHHTWLVYKSYRFGIPVRNNQ
jgi:hypothetical protein